MSVTYTASSAEFSLCRTYRYWLHRRWSDGPNGHRLGCTCVAPPKANLARVLDRDREVRALRREVAALAARLAEVERTTTAAERGKDKE